MKSPVRVLVVDDQVYVREGLKTLLEIEDAVEVVGEAGDGVEALEQVALLKPDVVLVDARMPKMDGVILVDRLSRDYPSTHALILTTFDDEEYIFGGLRAGAKGYLLKSTPPEELVSAILKVYQGRTVLGDTVTARVVQELKHPSMATSHQVTADDDPKGLLSAREIEVAGLVGTGFTNEEIARTLYISDGTARNHVSNIVRKLGFRDRVQLALYAVEHGWAKPLS